MKKLAIVVLLVVAGCHRQTMGKSVGGGGAATAREAIEAFILAGKAQDYDRMSLVFGTKDGPARGTTPKVELEKREFVMMRCLRHDRFQIGDATATPTGERISTVKLWFRDLTASANFSAVEGPNSRWYVLSFAIDDMQKICTAL